MEEFRQDTPISRHRKYHSPFTRKKYRSRRQIYISNQESYSSDEDDTHSDEYSDTTNVAARSLNEGVGEEQIEQKKKTAIDRGNISRFENGYSVDRPKSPTPQIPLSDEAWKNPPRRKHYFNPFLKPEKQTIPEEKRCIQEKVTAVDRPFELKLAEQYISNFITEHAKIAPKMQTTLVGEINDLEKVQAVCRPFESKQAEQYNSNLITEHAKTAPKKQTTLVGEINDLEKVQAVCRPFESKQAEQYNSNLITEHAKTAPKKQTTLVGEINDLEKVQAVCRPFESKQAEQYNSNLITKHAKIAPKKQTTMVGERSDLEKVQAVCRPFESKQAEQYNSNLITEHAKIAPKKQTTLVEEISYPEKVQAVNWSNELKPAEMYSSNVKNQRLRKQIQSIPNPERVFYPEKVHTVTSPCPFGPKNSMNISTSRAPEIQTTLEKRKVSALCSYDKLQKKGFLLVINFMFTGKYKRTGSDDDVGKLCKFFTNLKYDVDCRVDMTTEELRTCLENVRHNYLSRDSSKYYCFICVIMSHGNEVKLMTLVTSSLLSKQAVPLGKIGLISI
ncbi:uncharacterized protein LOC127714072 [Mytilus californianus]|uniref:uncharacterized protein LOC127714072 n=1 Tax=Mytilus californianus TaxID=6549 RepID=UPI002245F6B8|nr:uncharacterized protein LOC127714072 [Mytilus californianus]